MTADGRLPTGAVLHPPTASRGVAADRATELTSPAEWPLTADRPRSASVLWETSPRSADGRLYAFSPMPEGGRTVSSRAIIRATSSCNWGDLRHMAGRKQKPGHQRFQLKFPVAPLVAETTSLITALAWCLSFDHGRLSGPMAAAELVDTKPPVRVGARVQCRQSRIETGSRGGAGTRGLRGSAGAHRRSRSRNPTGVSTAERPYADQPAVQPDVWSTPEGSRSPPARSVPRRSRRRSARNRRST